MRIPPRPWLVWGSLRSWPTTSRSSPPARRHPSWWGIPSAACSSRSYWTAASARQVWRSTQRLPKGCSPFIRQLSAPWGACLTTWQGWKRILRMPLSDFRYAFVNTLPADRQAAVYERYVVPETGRIFFQAAISMLSASSPTAVHFENPKRAPLLLIAGGSDHIVPPAINRNNYRKYRGSPASTTFEEFPGRGHWIIAEDGWEEVAASIARWLAALPA